MAAISDILSEYCIIHTNGDSIKNGDGDGDGDGQTDRPESSQLVNQVLSTKFPAYDVPENIVLCVDVSSEMDRNAFRTKSGDLHSSMSLVKKAISIFVSTKFKFRSDHNIAVCSLFDEANTDEARFCEERRMSSLLSQVSELDAKYSQDTCDLSSLLTWLQDQLPSKPLADGLPPEYTLRLILIYGRSHTVPVIPNKEVLEALMEHPFFFLDVFYLHEHPDQNNKCEAIFDFFCSLDRRNASYVVEVTRSPTKLFDQMAQLLAHPLQRPPQSLACYKLE